MPACARKDGVDTVASPDGAGFCCGSPSTQRTAAGSATVFVNGIGSVRLGDAMVVHPFPGPCCAPHAPPLTKASSTVFVEARGMGRLGDDYQAHVVSSGSGNVFAGG